MTNFFWPVYKSLEKELIALSEQIHIDDNQLNVYSVKIAELLIRTVVEIEAISKELYFQNGGTGKSEEIFFDSDCLDLLENLWTMSKKEVIISSHNLYFAKDENKILTPFHKAHKRGSSGADWAKAYQGVKHDRVNKLQKGNLKHFIRALAALYILNIYYKGDDALKGVADLSLGSDIFNVTSSKKGEGYCGDCYEKAETCHICISKRSEVDFKNIVNAFAEDLKVQQELLASSPEFIKFLKNNPDFKIEPKETILGLCYKISEPDLAKRLFDSSKKGINLITSTKTHLVLNKNQQIYPDPPTGGTP